MRMFVLVCLVLSATSTAQALITFVDSSLDNTKIGGETPTTEEGQTGTYHLGNGSGQDGLWDWRADQPVNGGTLWQSDNAVVPAPSFDAESTNELSVTMTIPLAGTYDIYGYFIAGEPDWIWDCAFSLNPDPSTIYDKSNSTPASASDFIGTVIVENILGYAGLNLYQAAIGQITTTACNELVSVYIQGLDGGQKVDQRTWFDGVGYQTFESLFASTPNPGDWQTGVAHDVVLSWLPGIYATSHNVYFGADFNDVNDADRLAGDVDGNGQVNLFDVQELVQKWLGGTPECHIDLNDENFIAYAYGPNWGCWHTHLNPITIE